MTDFFPHRLHLKDLFWLGISNKNKKAVNYFFILFLTQFGEYLRFDFKEKGTDSALWLTDYYAKYPGKLAEDKNLQIGLALILVYHKSAEDLAKNQFSTEIWRETFCILLKKYSRDFSNYRDLAYKLLSARELATDRIQQKELLEYILRNHIKYVTAVSAGYLYDDGWTIPMPYEHRNINDNEKAALLLLFLKMYPDPSLSSDALVYIIFKKQWRQAIVLLQNRIVLIPNLTAKNADTQEILLHFVFNAVLNDEENTEELFIQLVKAGVSINEKNNDQLTVLERVIQHNRFDLVKIILSSRSDANAILHQAGQGGQTPLDHMASSVNSLLTLSLPPDPADDAPEEKKEDKSMQVDKKESNHKRGFSTLEGSLFSTQPTKKAKTNTPFVWQNTTSAPT